MRDDWCATAWHTWWTQYGDAARAQGWTVVAHDNGELRRWRIRGLIGVPDEVAWACVWMAAEHDPLSAAGQALAFLRHADFFEVEAMQAYMRTVRELDAT